MTAATPSPLQDLARALALRGRSAPLPEAADILRSRPAGRGPYGEAVTLVAMARLAGEMAIISGALALHGHGRLACETVGSGQTVLGRGPGAGRAARCSASPAAEGRSRAPPASSPRRACRRPIRRARRR